MSSDAYHGSTYGIGCFTEGKWYCQCGQSAVCQTVTKNTSNKGKKFWVCSKNRDERCLFFLWVEDEDEGKAKDQLGTLQLPPLPQTPTTTRNVSFPTPNSGDRMSTSNSTGSRSRLLQSLGASPTRSRFNDGSLNPEGESDLIETVLELIRSDHPDLKVSTEMKLRHEIGLKLDVDNSKLRRYEETISQQHQRIDELETASNS